MMADKSLGPLNSGKNLELASVSKKIQTPEAKLQNADVKQPFLKCRHIVAFVGFWCFFMGTNVRVNTSVNMVAMVNHSAVAQRAKVKSDSCPLLMPNSTQAEKIEINEDGEFLWSPEVQGYILGSYSLGHVISQIPTGRLVDIYGCKWFLFVSAFSTSVATFLIPVFTWISPEAVIALQFIRGLSQGILPPAGSVLVSKWFARSERGQMFSFMKSGASIGSIAASLLSGFLCASSGKWPSSFYVTGTIGLVVSIMCIFCLHESPEVHPRITKAELNFLLEDKEARLKKKNSNIPWRKMLTSVPVYALIYSNVGQGWTYAQFLIVHTIFLGNILHYPIAKNGMFTALTFLLQFVFIHIASIFSSLMIKKKIASITFTRKFWNFVSCLGFSASMLGIYLSGCNRSLSVVFAVLSTGFTGTGLSGSHVTVPEMAPAFAGILNGVNSTIACLPFIILPLIVGFLTDEQQTIEQWNKVFFIGIVVVMSSGIFYCIFGSAEVQPWNFVEEEKEEEKKESKPRF